MKAFGRLAAVVSVCLAVLAIVSLAASAASSRPLVVRGTQTVVDEPTGRFQMHGSLVGSWNTTAFTLHYAGADGQLVGSGKETFRGCHDTDRSGACDDGEPAGTLRFTFAYWATYKPGTEDLVRGQCIHPVVGGTGAFAGAKGVIHMTDRPSKRGVLTTYAGTLDVPRSAGAAKGIVAPGEGRPAAPSVRGAALGSPHPSPERWLASRAAPGPTGGCGR